MAALERLVKSATLIPKADLPTNVLEALQALPRSSETVSATQDVTGNRESAVRCQEASGAIVNGAQEEQGSCAKAYERYALDELQVCQLVFF